MYLTAVFACPLLGACFCFDSLVHGGGGLDVLQANHFQEMWIRSSGKQHASNFG